MYRMNKLLYISVYILGPLIVIELLRNYCDTYEYNTLFTLLIIGIITSLLNHGLTNDILKYLDRGVMVSIGLYLTILLYGSPKLRDGFWILVIAVMLYFSKFVIPNHKSHLLCHITIVIYIFIFLQNYKKKL